MSESTTGWDEPSAESPGTSVDKPPTQAVEEPTPPSVDSMWWLGIAAVPIWSALGVLMLVGGFIIAVAAPELGSVLLILFAILWGLGAMFLDFIFVIAIYLDARAVEDAGVEWDTEGDTYLLVAAIGLLVPMIHTVLALYYLHQRHRYVGVP